eukprot:CAMPEP_0201541702 /NCGR_PEP_ID=MMETSP0161_2-20130828/71618_1 /ASSEMBLY_ACC=CAM_ASM_000251 /TAXON_ID=180227 /ORGANISM="Neoparamoeba aestuarina, Strain SoJaBio B1-5/56/2" /LENGTH=76 /DNA_ID=CAMNT_0047949257 /DNA_START=106 /DNA_END=337 /DNA_ORIENTATION=-
MAEIEVEGAEMGMSVEEKKEAVHDSLLAGRGDEEQAEEGGEKVDEEEGGEKEKEEVKEKVREKEKDDPNNPSFQSV